MVQIRPAGPEDMPEVLSMIQELACFERQPTGPKLTLQDLIRDGGFGPGNAAPLFQCAIAEVLEANADGTSQILKVGYTISYYTYSTWQGKSLFLEDLYVKPAYRKRGIGTRLFVNAAKHAVEVGCKRMDFHVLKWNPARQFYETIGAIDMSELEGWLFYRIPTQALNALSAKAMC